MEFARCLSRLAAPAARAALFERDVPSYMSSAERLLFSVFGELRLPKERRARSYRFAVSAP